MSGTLPPPSPIPLVVPGAPAQLPTTQTGSLTGRVVTIDPGHNGTNGSNPGFINSQIWNEVSVEFCDTAGTATDAGYSESQFNFDLAEYLASDLRALGASVEMTRISNSGVGPCVNQRADIGNTARSDAAISIHADGGPPSGRVFAVLEPVGVGPNNSIISASTQLAVDIRNEFAVVTGEPVSNYDGIDGIQPRSDLGGLNLSTVPKVVIECANMRNSADASLVVSDSWQASAAAALAAGLTSYLQ